MAAGHGCSTGLVAPRLALARQAGHRAAGGEQDTPPAPPPAPRLHHKQQQCPRKMPNTHCAPHDVMRLFVEAADAHQSSLCPPAPLRLDHVLPSLPHAFRHTLRADSASLSSLLSTSQRLACSSQTLRSPKARPHPRVWRLPLPRRPAVPMRAHPLYSPSNPVHPASLNTW